MRSYLSLLLTILFAHSLLAQKNNPQSPSPSLSAPFSEVAEHSVPTGGERRIVPQKYRTAQLDVAALQSFLQKAPVQSATMKPEALPVLALPLPDGQTGRFRLVESSVMEDELQDKYPDIRCYTGIGIDDPTALLKCDFTPWGFHAMILSDRSSAIFIDPYAHGDRDFYTVYYKKDYQRNDPNALFTCGTDTENMTELKKGPAHNPDFQSDCKLRSYRLALACTGEYAAFHGGTKPLVLAAMNTTMNRVNGVYQRDLAVTMKLVAKNDTLLFFSTSGDPYANNNGSTMLGQNVTTCNNRIGLANYDIGHVFSTGGGGIAGLGVVCSNSKARGVTGSDTPIGDPFDIDYVAHEMGHQFGAEHTFNSNLGSCQGNGNAATAMEPGSGTTIMAYAGICGAHDVQSNSDDYFHAISLQEIGTYITTGAGNGCAVKTITGNNAPTVSAGADYIIPKSTPFSLTATGSDVDGNTLTYCWEEMDAGTAALPPVGTNLTGPMFRSFDPSTSPTRFFPRLSDLNANTNYNWEELPSVARTMKFRVTVRDNSPVGGCTKEDDMVVTVNATAGPLQVTEPNTNVTWIVGETRTVTWNVAGTNLAPINCANVRILLSLNGGQTYPIVWAASVPNNGSAVLMVPNNPSNVCRLKVEAIGNIFYDISNTNFKIQLPVAPTFLMTASASSAQVCAGDSTTLTLTANSVSGFNTPVVLTATGGPAGAVFQFSPNPLVPTDNALLTIKGITPAMAGTYNITLQGTAGAITQTLPLSLTVLPGRPVQPPGLNSPADGTTAQNSTVVLKWSTVQYANNYTIEWATSPSFDASSLAGTQSTNKDSLKIIGLSVPKVYYWRVLASNNCGSTVFSPTYAFQTGKGICNQTFSSSDVPKIIDGNSVNTVTSKITMPLNIGYSDLNVQLKVNHGWVGDLIANLISPSGKKARLFDQVGVPSIDDFGCSGENLDLIFDDEASVTAVTLDTTCGSLIPSLTGTYQPIEPLGTLQGKTAKGDWTLEVMDAYEEDGGSLVAWSIIFCFPDTVAKGTLLANNPLDVPTGGNAPVTDVFLNLKTSGTVAQGVFSMLAPPQHGTLRLNNTALGVGSTFTQADINTGLLQYAHNGDTASTDQFRFDALDANDQSWLRNGSFQIFIVKNTLVATAEQTKAVPCHDGLGGEITASAGGLNGPYQYSLNGSLPQSDAVFSNLAPGTYSVVITGQYGFTAAASPVVLDNPIAVQAAASANDNDVTVTASGGTGVFEYSLNGIDFQTSNLFENLPNATYTLIARDANGCTASASATVFINTLVVSANVAQPVKCFGNADGSLSVAVSGGRMPFEYSLDGVAFQLENTFGGLAAGAYTVVVKDSDGFTRTTAPVTITQPDALAAAASVTTDSLTASATGGTPAFEYSLDGMVFQSSPLFDSLPNGVYTLIARDANGCTAAAQAIVAVNSMIADATILKTVACLGGTDGSISVMVGGGQPPYEYSLNGTDFQISNIFTGLAAGSYTVLVKDSQNFTASTIALEVTEPTLVTASASVNLNVITAAAAGGTGAFSYSLDGQTFQISPAFTVLASGDYTVTAKDANGCTATASATVSIPTLTASSIIPMPILCNGGTADLRVVAEGGVPPYLYRLENGVYQADNTFFGLLAGTYTAFVKDATGTEFSLSDNLISQPDAFTVAVTVVGNDASFNITGNTGPYTYELNGIPDAVLEDLPNNEYVLVVADKNNCPKEVIFTVNYTVLSASSQVNDPDICDGKANIAVTAAGGVPPYEYALHSMVFGSDSLFLDVQRGEDTVWVRDAQGLLFVLPVTVNVPELLSISASKGLSSNSIVASASGGEEPYWYSIDGTNFQLGNEFNNLQTGTYVVTTRDVRGCTAVSMSINAVNATVEPGAFWGISVSPNPGSGLFRLLVKNAPDALHAEVLDATGRSLRAVDFAPNGGSFTTLLDLTDLPQGIYALRLTDGRHSGALRLSVVR